METWSKLDEYLQNRRCSLMAKPSLLLSLFAVSAKILNFVLILTLNRHLFYSITGEIGATTLKYISNVNMGEKEDVLFECRKITSLASSLEYLRLH